MDYRTICWLEKATDKLEETIFVIGAIPVGILYTPIYIAIKLHEWCQKKKQMRIIDRLTNVPEDIKTLPYNVRLDMVEKGKIKISTLPHDRKNYLHCRDNNLYPFHRERKFKLGLMEIAYVENTYSKRMHRFFEEQAEWIKDFEYWHGFKIVFIDYDEMKDGMFFPQDFDDYMNHGFLCNKYISSADPEYAFICDDHMYVDINLTTDEDIKRQMHLFMSQVYNTFQWRLI